MSFENCTRMKSASRKFQPSSSNRKFQVIFASPNRYYTWHHRKQSLSAPVFSRTTLLIPVCHTRCEQILHPFVFLSSSPVSEQTVRRQNRAKRKGKVQPLCVVAEPKQSAFVIFCSTMIRSSKFSARTYDIKISYGIFLNDSVSPEGAQTHSSLLEAKSLEIVWELTIGRSMKRLKCT